MILHRPVLLALLLPCVCAAAGAQSLGPRTSRRLDVRPALVKPRSQTPPNILLIVADDLGVDLVGAYAEGSDPPCTPVIDGLAAEGMLFRNAWSNPTCSPTRAALLTGRHGFRTGIGEPVTGMSLSTSETLLPELLADYDSRCLGKWHLSGSAGSLHPNQSGFAYFAGSLGGALPSYSQWNKIVNGTAATTNVYATRDTANEAILGIQGMQAPWFQYVAFNAPHTPFHRPPMALCNTPSCPGGACGALGPNPSNVDLGKAMVEVLDAQIGRILDAVDAMAPETLVIFIGDNGTAQGASESPFLGAHAKGTLYEGGINVPLIVRGPNVQHAECTALVSVVDLFATLGQLAGQPAATEDSVSMLPYFANPHLSLRENVYSETFSPNGTGPYTKHDRAIRDERYKLIRRQGQADEFFDLWIDAFESQSLLPSLSIEEQRAHDRLVARLVELGVS